MDDRQLIPVLIFIGVGIALTVLGFTAVIVYMMLHGYKEIKKYIGGKNNGW